MKLLKFQATWCGPCKSLTKIMEGVTHPVPVEVYDIDEQQDVAIAFNIRSVPTLVLVDNEGNELKRSVGMMNADQLVQFVQL